MNGRSEQELLAKKKIIEKIQKAPKYIEDFYYTINNNEYNTVTSYINIVLKYIDFLSKEGVNIKDPYSLSMKADIYVGKYFTMLKFHTVNGVHKETSASYRAVVWSALNYFYSFALRHEYVKYNPMTTIKRPKPSTDIVTKEALSTNELKIVIDNINKGVSNNGNAVRYHEQLKNRDLLLILILLDTATRITGALEINLNDLDLENNQVRITSKGNKTDVFELAGETMACLKRWLQDREQLVENPQNQALFVTRYGERMSYQSANKLVKKYSYNIEKTVTPHTTRRTVATLIYKKTKDLELVKDKLQHASVKTSSRYIIKDDSWKKEAKRISRDIFSDIM